MDIEAIKDISSIKKLLEEMYREQRLTNVLLRAMIKDDDTSYDLPQDHRICAGKSFSIIHPDYLQVKEWLTGIALRDGKKVVESEGESLHSFCTAITSMNPGDYLLICNDDLIKLPGSADIVVSAYNNGVIEIVVGEGDQTQKVELPVPEVNYVIWSDTEQLTPFEIIDVFPIANR